MSRNQGVFSIVKPLVLLLLTVSLIYGYAPTAFGMPPHPDLVKQIEEGSKPLPYYLANRDFLAYKGINQPSEIGSLAEKITGAKMAAPGPSGTFNALALLVDFSDEVASVTASYFDTLIFGTGTGTVRDYYDEVSYGTLTIVSVNLPSQTGWLRAPNTYAYYCNGQNGFGTYPQNVQKLVEDVVDAADSVVNFANYDNDLDGYVDALFVVHAGPGAEFTGSDHDIWSHQWVTYSPHLKDGVYIYPYSMEPEYWISPTPGDMTCGVYAHELGHVFGLPDLYDYDYNSEGVGDWSLMAGGSWNGSLGASPAHFDAWCRVMLDFVTPTVVSADTPGLSISAVETTPQVYYLWDCGAASNEYFLIENRQSSGYDAALPGFGLLIWHVDETQFDNDGECRSHNNCVCPRNYLVALEQADGNLDLEYNSDAGDSGDPYPGVTVNRTFNLSSTPNSGSYADCSSTVAVENISNSGAVMTADVNVCTSSSDLTEIHLSSPPNSSTLFTAPNFIWTVDGGTDNVFAVDLALPPSVPFWSTYQNLHILIDTTNWTMPTNIWNFIPSGSLLYWRVRGIDRDAMPMTLVTSDEIWAFWKN